MEAVIFIGIQGTGKKSQVEEWQRGINFNELPLWQRRGTGLYWQRYQKIGTNPLTQEVVSTTRR